VVDPFLAGDGTLDLTIDGNVVSVVDVGAAAGPGGDPDTQTDVLILASLGHGEMLAILIETDNDLLGPGITLEIDAPPTLGLVFYLRPGSDAELVGLLADGFVHFDEAGADYGAPVTGSLQADVYSPFF